MKWRFRFNIKKSKTMMVDAKCSRGEWKINERIENVEVIKYLRVWLDRGMSGNIHLEKMREKAEKLEARIGCVSRVNGVMEVNSGRLIWQLLARPCLEHASEVWWTGWKTACKNLKNNQEIFGRKLVWE